MTEQAIRTGARPLPWRAMMPWLTAAAVYLLLLLLGDRLLNDPDSYWHLVVGRWIFAHGAVPYTDPFSATMAGQPWIAKEWLSQVIYAGAFALGGWNAVVVLAAASIALAFGLLTRFLLEKLDPVPVLALVVAAVVLAAPHMVARPHALALPLMVAWVGGLVRALDAGRPPPLVLLPLMLLWANMHGGFTLGLALIAPIALEAVLAAPAAERRPVAVRWAAFGLAAALAACITPYGPQSILVTPRLLGMGEVLSIVVEWRPQDFGRFEPFELLLLLGIGFALYRGLTLPPLRIVVILGLLHLALAHVRNAEVLGLLAPLFLAEPLRAHFALAAQPADSSPRMAAVATVALLGVATVALALLRPVVPNPNITPERAVAAILRANAGPIFNDYEFGGYLVHAGIAPFIDGRNELYGGPFTVRHHRAVKLENLPDFLRLLDEYKIGATLLAPSRPAVALLDRLPEWQRIHADDVAVVHVRRNRLILDHGMRLGALSAPWPMSNPSTATR